ncbi:MAG: glycosyltransferase, partial [Alphaproteobacteria bacterium]|nr:glycosyltransferase [Alphaproteobacteria bacterium]
RVFIPSRDAAERIAGHFPGLACVVQSHPEPPRRAAIRRPASREAARVAVIGAIGPNKGYDLLLACARDALKRGLRLEFRLFGYVADPAPLQQLGNVRFVGPYARSDLPRLVAENPCDLALFLSIWPETYCYALSDAYAAGLYPVALACGALEERIAASGVGTLLPLASGPAEINSAILSEVERSSSWPVGVEIGAEPSALLADYYRLTPPEAVRQRRKPRRNKS